MASAANREGGIFVGPSNILEQLSSPYDALIRLVWAPLVLAGAIYAQMTLIDEYGAWGYTFLLVAIPIISWSLMGIFCSNKFRRAVTYLIFHEAPDLFFESLEFVWLVVRGMFNIVGSVLKAIVHIFD